MSKIDKDLAGALKQAKTKTMHFALVEKTQGEGTLIVSKNPIPQSAIAEAQKDLGGGKVYKGQCATDPKTGELVFETATDPPTTKTLKAVISRDAGLTLKVNSRKAESKKPPITIDDVMDTLDADKKQEVAKRLADIAAGETYKKLLSAGGPVADALRKQMDEVKKLIRLKEYKKAAEALDALQKLIDQPTEDT